MSGKKRTGLVFMVAMVAALAIVLGASQCAQAPSGSPAPHKLGAGVGPDPAATGIVVSYQGVQQTQAFACEAGLAVVFDAGGYPGCALPGSTFDAASVIPQTTGALLDNAGALSTLGCASGNVYQGAGSSAVPTCGVVTSAEIATALTTPGAIGGTQANVVSATRFFSDGGMVMQMVDAAISEDPFDFTLPGATGWTNIPLFPISPSTFGNNRKDEWYITFDCSEGTDGGAYVTGNMVAGTTGCFSKVDVDGGESVKALYSTGTSWGSTVNVPVVASSSTWGCTNLVGDAGCTDYATNSAANPQAIQVQCVTSASGFAIQFGYLVDSGSYPTLRCVVEVNHYKRSFP